MWLFLLGVVLVLVAMKNPTHQPPQQNQVKNPNPPNHTIARKANTINPTRQKYTNKTKPTEKTYATTVGPLTNSTTTYHNTPTITTKSAPINPKTTKPLRNSIHHAKPHHLHQPSSLHRRQHAGAHGGSRRLNFAVVATATQVVKERLDEGAVVAE